METSENKITILETQMKHVQDEVKELRKETAIGFKEILTKIDGLDYKYVRSDVYEADLKRINENIDDNTGSRKGTWTLIISAVVGALISGAVGMIFR